MNTHRLTTMAMAVVLAGFMQALAADETVPVNATDDMPQQNISEQKPGTEILVSEFEMPAQTVAQPADNLLSDMKVYPSF